MEMTCFSLVILLCLLGKYVINVKLPKEKKIRKYIYKILANNNTFYENALTLKYYLAVVVI